MPVILSQAMHFLTSPLAPRSLAAEQQPRPAALQCTHVSPRIKTFAGVCTSDVLRKAAQQHPNAEASVHHKLLGSKC
jgi:hypothetical protein